MGRIVEAKELMEKFPEQTKSYTWKQVADMWEDYSDSYAAGWLIPDEDSVNYVFAPTKFIRKNDLPGLLEVSEDE